LWGERREVQGPQREQEKQGASLKKGGWNKDRKEGWTFSGDSEVFRRGKHDRRLQQTYKRKVKTRDKLTRKQTWREKIVPNLPRGVRAKMSWRHCGEVFKIKDRLEENE